MKKINNGRDIYFKHTEKYLDLLEGFMNYITTYRTDITIPDQANLVFFDAKDINFSNYSLNILKKLIQKNEKNIVEVTKTGSKTIPWRVSQSYLPA